MFRHLRLLALLPIALLFLASCEPYQEDFQAKFTNHLYTGIEVTVHGYGSRIIPPGATTVFWIDPNAHNYSYYARTCGTDYYGDRIGLLLEWNYTEQVYGYEHTTDLIIEDNLFFLNMRNVGWHNMTPLYVNCYSTAQTVDDIVIPNDGETYTTGYYRAYLNTMVMAYWQGHPDDFTYWVQGSDFNLPWSNNQSVTLWNDFKGGDKTAPETRYKVKANTYTVSPSDAGTHKAAVPTSVK